MAITANTITTLVNEIPALDSAKNLSLTELSLFINLQTDTPVKYVVDETLLSNLERMKRGGLIQLLKENIEPGTVLKLGELAAFTDRGAVAFESVLSLLPAPDPEIVGDDINFLIDLASTTRVNVARTSRVLNSLRSLVRSGHIQTIAASDDPLAELAENFNLDDVVKLTRLGRRILGLGENSENTPSAVPLVFPVRLQVVHEKDGETHSAPLPLMPYIFRKGYQLAWDFSAGTLQALGHSNPFEGRDWTYVIVMYDHENDGEQRLPKNTKLFHKALYKGETSKTTAVQDKAFALFLIPLDDRTPYEMLKEGEGTFYKFDDDKRFREVLTKVIEIAGSVKSATPLDFKSDLAQSLLKEIGLDHTVREPEAIVKELQKLEALLVNGKLPRKLGDGAIEVAKGLLSGLLGPVSVPLGIAVNALKALRIAYDLQNEHHFELLELDAEVDEAGTTVLRIKPEDVSRIRLDKNKEGERNLDLRHILVYRYRPTAVQGTRLGLVINDGKPSVALLQDPEKVPPVKVGGGDKFIFEPSLTLSMTPLSQPLELTFNEKPVCEVVVDHLGRVHLSGLNGLFERSERPEVRFRAGLGFDVVTSLFFALER